MANTPNEDELITAEVTTSTNEEAPSNGPQGNSVYNVSDAKPEKESCGWCVYYWVGMLSAFGLGALIAFCVMMSRESSSFTTIPNPPISHVLDWDTSSSSSTSSVSFSSFSSSTSSISSTTSSISSTISMQALDPSAITAAVEVSEDVVRKLLEKIQDENGGNYPESIAFTLWGNDNNGESLVQVLALVGVRPVADSLGRVNKKVELIPLEELGRPRIDVVVSCSGVFRDLFINQMNLMDRGIKMAAEADEPIEMNFVRKHAEEQAKELGVSLREAAARVFSNSAGSYSANVGLAIEYGGWEDESQLQDQFLTRKGFVFNADKPGMMEHQADLFKSALSTVDVTFQKLDFSEISITDVSHYYDSDPTKVVQGLRNDGKKPMSLMADTTTANAQVRTLSETVRLDARTKLLNPKFYEDILSIGYEGVREIQKRLRNTMGWSATAGEVDNFVFEDANDTFINDPEMQQRLLDTNPNAFRDMVTTFLEANRRGYWDTSEENIERLQELYTKLRTVSRHPSSKTRLDPFSLDIIPKEQILYADKQDSLSDPLHTSLLQRPEQSSVQRGASLPGV